jgi:hypothetical protein
MSLREKTTIEAPHGYWAKADDRAWRSIAVMADIAATKGARFIEPTERLTQEQMTDLVQTLARLHGGLWEDPAIRQLNTLRQYIQRTTEFVALRERARVGMERARNEIPAALHGQADRIYDATVESLATATDRMPQTLLHGDAHVGQTYVTAEGRMGYTDWHHCLRGAWAYDFAYCVNSACEPEDRRAWQHELMEIYLEALARRRRTELRRCLAGLPPAVVLAVHRLGVHDRPCLVSAGDAARRPLPRDHPADRRRDRRPRLVRRADGLSRARLCGRAVLQVVTADVAAHQFGLVEFGGGAGERDPAAAEEVDAIGEFQSAADVLLDEEQ